MTDIDPRIATDLDAVKVAKLREEVEAKRAAEEQAAREQAAMEETARAWERSMRRTFKGIFPHKTRKRWLLESRDA